MKAVEKGAAPKIPEPDLFGVPINYVRLKECIPSYRKSLGKFLLLSSFSYFEAYISDVLLEIFEFHGGMQRFVDLAVSKRNSGLILNDPNMESMIRHLRERPKKGKESKYLKANAELSSTGYCFPTDFFSAYGIMQFKKRLEDMRASHIPVLLEESIGLKLQEDDVENFSRIRELRNEIAHGRISEVDLRAAIEDNKFLRSLAVKIDAYVVKHFFVVEV